MILSDEQLEERLNSPDNIVNLVERNSESHLKVISPEDTGVGKRGPQIPDMIRRLIAQTANGSDETKTEVANIFSVGVPTVSNSSRGLIHNRLDTDLQELASKTKAEKTEMAHEAALDSLIGSLGLVNARLPEIDDVKTAAKIAVDMSRVVSQLRDKDAPDSKVRTLVVVTMPNVKKESQFETIDV